MATSRHIESNNKFQSVTLTKLFFIHYLASSKISICTNFEENWTISFLGIMKYVNPRWRPGAILKAIMSWYVDKIVLHSLFSKF